MLPQQQAVYSVLYIVCCIQCPIYIVCCIQCPIYIVCCIQCPIYSMLHTVSYIWYTHSGLFNAAVPGAGEETAEKRKEDHKEVKRTGH